MINRLHKVSKHNYSDATYLDNYRRQDREFHSRIFYLVKPEWQVTYNTTVAAVASEKIVLSHLLCDGQHDKKYLTNFPDSRLSLPICFRQYQQQQFQELPNSQCPKPNPDIMQTIITRLKNLCSTSHQKMPKV